MTLDQLIVTLLGAGAIGWVNYYFFVAGRRSKPGTDESP